MSNENPNMPGQDNQSEPTIPTPEELVFKAQLAGDKAAENTATVFNQYLGTNVKSEDVHPARYAGAVVSIAITAGIAYYAGKRGVKAGMKGYIDTAQTFVDSAGYYADAAKNYAHMSEDNAKACFDASQGLIAAAKIATKAVKKG